MKIVVIIPVYGQDHLTENVLRQISEEDHPPDLEIFVTVVDNGASEILEQLMSQPRRRYIRNRTNMGWLKACNIGVKDAIENTAISVVDAVVLLNNDVVLSKRFFRGLCLAYKASGAGLIGPFYDDVNVYQRPIYYVDESHQGPVDCPAADSYIPRSREEVVPFIDGTCMFIPREVWEEVGPLDEEHFGLYGWGADFDYTLRVKATGRQVMATERSYLNHLGRATTKVVEKKNEHKLEG